MEETAFHTLAAEQKTTGENIQRIIRNYKKDPADRKTSAAYYKERLEKLTTCWKQFEDTDIQIRAISNFPSDHEYFTTNYYNELFAVVKTFTREFQLKLQHLLQPSKPDNPTEMAPHSEEPSAQSLEGASAGTSINAARVHALIRKQQAMIASLERLLNGSIKHSAPLQCVAAMDKLWTQIEDINFHLWEIHDDPTSMGYNMQTYTNLEGKVLEHRVLLLKNPNTIPPRDTSTDTSTPLQLPKIELPKFNGDYLKWRQFFDLFSEIIHKQQIPKCQKMWYLKTNLCGEAEKLLQHFTITEENYDTAWAMLQDRYNNKRQLVSVLLEKLLGQPSSSHENTSANFIKLMHDTTKECLQCLENLGISTTDWDPLLLHILIKKLDRTTHTLYEQSLNHPREVQRLASFLSFLEARFHSLEAVGFTSKEKPKTYKTLTAAVEKKTKDCKLCKQRAHPLYACNKFKAMDPAKRLQYVKQQKLCINCMQAGHFSNVCQARTCTKCDRKHNTMLHGRDRTPHLEDQTTKSTPDVSSSTTLAGYRSNSQVLLSTVKVHIHDKFGNPVTCRAVLDCGSQANYISKKLASKLRLQTKYNPHQINGIGQTNHNSHYRMTVLVSSMINGFNERMEAFILNEITSEIPSQTFDVSNWSIPANLQLADPGFNKRGPIDLLIGNEIFYKLLMVGQIKLGNHLPTLQNTVFGWVLGGAIHDSRTLPSEQSTFCGIGVSDNEALHEEVKRFWQLEEIDEKTSSLTNSEKKCETFFDQTVQRTSQGRFSVRLPFSQDPSVLGDTRTVSLQRFHSLERRLTKNPELHSAYVNFMKEYETLEHMTEFDVKTISSVPRYFIPHHCVLNPKSTSTKLRVVFDASMTSSSNHSLNDILLTGPKLQQELFSVLLRFRIPKYVFTADIEKMYRQIEIDERDRPFQLIWWRENITDPLKCFALNTVTYGITSAPYLAIKCLQKLALQHQVTEPQGAEVIRRDFYVDDVMSGADSLVEATAIQNQIITILNSAGFKLKKWCVNHPTLWKDIPFQDRAPQTEINQHDTTVRTLGMIWNPTSDEFHLQIRSTEACKVTKRQVLSDIAHIFDPLGFVSPVITKAKIFLQHLWALKLDWDSAVPQDLHTYWMHFRTSLRELDKIKLPRQLFSGRLFKSQQLHVFCDASEKAYGAVIYGRAQLNDGTIIVRWLCARSRVAPTKTVTLPRLELCAAHLAAKLLVRVRSDLAWNHPCYLWSDSEIALAWIAAKSASYQTFVSNRVAVIQELTIQNQWRYVPTQYNPADLVSRGLHPQDLKSNTMWFYGPLFLHGPQTNWPANLSHPVTELESRKKVTLTSCLVVTNLIDSINHRNSFKLLLRICAYILRFVDKCRKTISGRFSESLEIAEINKATIVILREIQSQEFSIVINQLRRHGAVTKNSNISSLSPFLDKDQLLRVGGRLENSELSYEAKHPVLLPYNHMVTKMLMTDLHNTHSHIGPQGLLSITRQNYWPIKGKTTARSIVQNCIRCVKAKAKCLEQHMGSLPAKRVQSARPFINSGVDFCGPFYIHFKIRGKQPRKCYVAIFCCFATKAVHIEIVSDLTTDSFVGALKRFISRRGHCRHIHCDNATNFVGARNQLQALTDIIHSKEAKEKIKAFGLHKGIEFHFIPARSPHFGGLWEAAVKSAKHLFYKRVNAVSLTYEEMETVFTEIEAILNSRPMTPMSDDPNEFRALTPGHFLIGEPLTSTIDPVTEEFSGNLRQRWKLVSSLKAEFWQRWTKEYLSELQHRHKWKQTSSNVKPGTMVLIHEENVPSLKWKLGRILRTIPGADGLVRVAEVQTATGPIKRAIHKLAPLPIATSESSKPKDQISLVSQVRCSNKRSSVGGRSCSKLRRGLSPTTILCILLALISAIFAQSTTINEPFAMQPGLYFERLGLAHLTTANWNLVVFFNMTPYWTEYDNIQQGIAIASEYCSRLNHLIACHNTMKQFNNKLEDINRYHRFVTPSNQHRIKRSVPFGIIGNLANVLFGVLDSDYAESMSKVINDIHNNEEYLLNLLKNSTSILDATTNILSQTNDELQRLGATLDKTQKEILELFTWSQEHKRAEVFNALSLQLSLSIAEYQRTQEKLVDVLTDSHKSKVNPFLVSPEQLQEQLNIMKTHIPSQLRIPGHGLDITEIYKLLSIEGRVTDTHIIFRLTLPLLGVDDFELLHVVPVPTHLNNNSFITIQNTPEFLLTDLHRNQFYPLSHPDLLLCIHLRATGYICKQHHPIFRISSTTRSCEMSFLRHEPQLSLCDSLTTTTSAHWIQLMEENTVMYISYPERIVTQLCGTSLSQIHLVGTGIIKIKPNCVLKDESTTITSHSTYGTSMITSILPNVNLVEILSTNQSWQIPYHDRHNGVNMSAQLQQLQKQLVNLQQTESKSLKDSMPEDYHLGISFSTLIVLAILILILLVRCCIKHHPKTSSQGEGPVPVPRTQHEFNINLDDQ